MFFSTSNEKKDTIDTWISFKEMIPHLPSIKNW